VLTIASGPAGGGHRPQPARAGAPRPIPDATSEMTQVAATSWVPSTRPDNCLSIDGKGGWDRQKSNTSVVKATMMNQIAFPQ